jgi:hypothetical protein
MDTPRGEHEGLSGGLVVAVLIRDHDPHEFLPALRRKWLRKPPSELDRDLFPCIICHIFSSVE